MCRSNAPQFPCRRLYTNSLRPCHDAVPLTITSLVGAHSQRTPLSPGSLPPLHVAIPHSLQLPYRRHDLPFHYRPRLLSGAQTPHVPEIVIPSAAGTLLPATDLLNALSEHRMNRDPDVKPFSHRRTLQRDPQREKGSGRQPIVPVEHCP